MKLRLGEATHRYEAKIKELEEQLRWRVWADEPPEPGQDCLVMEGGGQVHRDNMPERGPGEYVVWWRPFGEEPEGIE